MAITTRVVTLIFVSFIRPAEVRGVFAGTLITFIYSLRIRDFERVDNIPLAAAVYANGLHDNARRLFGTMAAGGGAILGATFGCCSVVFFFILNTTVNTILSDTVNECSALVTTNKLLTTFLLVFMGGRTRGHRRVFRHTRRRERRTRVGTTRGLWFQEWEVRSSGTGVLDTTRGRCAGVARAPVGGLITSLTIPAIVDVLVAAVCGTASACFISGVGVSTDNTANIIFDLVTVLRTFNFVFNRNSNDHVDEGLNTRGVRGTQQCSSAKLFLTLLANTLVKFLNVVFLAPFVHLLNDATAVLPCSGTCKVFVLTTNPTVAKNYITGGVLECRNGTSLTVIKLATNNVLGVVLSPVLVFNTGVKVTNTKLSATVSRCVSFTVLVVVCCGNSTRDGPRVGCVALGPQFITAVVAANLPDLTERKLGDISGVILGVRTTLCNSTYVTTVDVITGYTGLVFDIYIKVKRNFRPISTFGCNTGGCSEIGSKIGFA